MTTELAPLIDAMRAAAQRATPGPWTREKPGLDPTTGFRSGVAVASTYGVAVASTYGRQMIYADPPGGSFPSADADHIATSNPAAVLAVIAALESVERERDEAKTAAIAELLALMDVAHTKDNADALRADVQRLTRELAAIRAERDALAARIAG